jgi:crotonobetainyl-CoA:carnitine CoA-transferase CaiB-like acyl-CoA transferase
MSDYARDLRPLAGLRVMEISRGIAGASAGALLRSWGAEVVLVVPEEGHPLATQAPFSEAGVSLHDVYFNSKKERRTVAGAVDAALLADLGAGVDGAILEGDPPEVAALAAALKIPAVTITPFGLLGPRRHWKSSELVAQAYAGILFITGAPEREPLRIGVPLCEYAAGQAAAAALLSAVVAEAPQYRHAEVSVVEAALSIMEHSFATWEFQRRHWPRRGNHGTAAWGIYPCKDGYVGVISGLGESWQRFRRLIGGGMLDEKYAQISARGEHADDVHAFVLGWLAERTAEEAFRDAQDAGLPFSILADAGQVLGLDQLEARGYFEERALNGTVARIPGQAARFFVEAGL